MDKKSNGFTLVELIVVIAILGIIAGIAVPRLFGFKGMAEERVCHANRKTVERMYSVFLFENDHEESLFIELVQLKLNIGTSVEDSTPTEAGIRNPHL